LADPTDYVKAEEIAKIVVRYIANTRENYERLKGRFSELYGKRVVDAAWG